MSLASKAVLAISCLSTLGIFTYVHFKQQIEKYKNVLHSFWLCTFEKSMILFYFREQLQVGVIRDQENQARRRRENIYILEKQAAIAEELRRAELEKS